jgi:hypothetical protein
MGEAKRLKIPQADIVSKIQDIPLAIEDGSNTPERISSRYGFDRRQALYYLQAGLLLGLVVNRKKRYLLSGLGRQYVNLTPGKRKEIILKRMLSCSIIASIIIELFVAPSRSLPRERIVSIVSHRSGISGTTIERRVRSILSWLTWIGEETGTLRVSRERVWLLISP